MYRLRQLFSKVTARSFCCGSFPNQSRCKRYAVRSGFLHIYIIVQAENCGCASGRSRVFGAFYRAARSFSIIRSYSSSER